MFLSRDYQESVQNYIFILRVNYINPFPNRPLFLRVCSTSLLKTQWKKKKLLVTSNFSFSQCFLPLKRALCHFHHVKSCHLQTLSVWKSLKFVIWERVKILILRMWTVWDWLYNYFLNLIFPFLFFMCCFYRDCKG